jgi:hypothetical protein
MGAWTESHSAGGMGCTRTYPTCAGRRPGRRVRKSTPPAPGPFVRQAVSGVDPEWPEFETPDQRDTPALGDSQAGRTDRSARPYPADECHAGRGDRHPS